MLQLLLSALANPFRRGYGWLIFVVLLAATSFAGGFSMILPPKEFTTRPPILAIEAQSGCRGPWTVYAGVRDHGRFIIAVVADADSPLAYADKFGEIVNKPDRSQPYAPINEMTDRCGSVMDISLVGPKYSQLTPLGAVFGGADIQNGNLGSSVMSEFNRFIDADAEIKERSAADEESALKYPDGSIAFMIPTLKENEIGYVALKEDQTALEVLQIDSDSDIYSLESRPYLKECIEDESKESQSYDQKCAMKLKASARKQRYQGSHLARICLPGEDDEQSDSVPVECENRMKAISAGGDDYPVVPVALVFELNCPSCKTGNRTGLSISAAFDSLLILGMTNFEREFSYAPISNIEFDAAPWRTDSSARDTSAGNWLTRRFAYYRSNVIDSYVWTPTGELQRRTVFLTLGSILMGLGLTLLAEVLIVLLHPGIRLGLVPPVSGSGPTGSSPEQTHQDPIRDELAPIPAQETPEQSVIPESDTVELHNIEPNLDETSSTPTDDVEPDGQYSKPIEKD